MAWAELLHPNGFRRCVKLAKSKKMLYTCVMGTWKSKNRNKYAGSEQLQETTIIEANIG